ncbi:MAG: hypothetical protein LUG99_11955 [Lachnospiraceae bacterium]|nr:hypothetical protein [Lachnospiraceae bacterium]
MSIMELIFDGCIYPGEQAVPDSPEYHSLHRETGAKMEKLSEKLSAEDYDEIEKVCDMVVSEDDMVNKECFRYGFAMGLLLMQEAMGLRYFKPKKDMNQECHAEKGHEDTE